MGYLLKPSGNLLSLILFEMFVNEREDNQRYRGLKLTSNAYEFNSSVIGV